MSRLPTRRLMTHTQFEELRRFEDGHAHYVFRSPVGSLTTRGWLGRVPDSGETRRSSAWRITEQGITALAAYRIRWKVPDAEVGARVGHGPGRRA